jgi:hypothetical protein
VLQGSLGSLVLLCVTGLTAVLGVNLCYWARWGPWCYSALQGSLGSLVLLSVH